VDDEPPRCLFPSLELIAKSNSLFFWGFRERESVEMNQFNIVVLVSFRNPLFLLQLQTRLCKIKTNEIKFNNIVYFILLSKIMYYSILLEKLDNFLANNMIISTVYLRVDPNLAGLNNFVSLYCGS